MVPLLALAWVVAQPALADAPARTEADARVALAGELEAARARSPNVILVAAAGPDAERVANATLAQVPPGGVKLVRVGLLGEPEAEVGRALAESKLDCAVRIGPAPTGGYAVSTHGACTPAPATSGASTDTAIPAIAAPDDAVLESTYKMVALRRVPVARDGRAAWEVRDGRGKRLGAVELARATGDAAAEHRLVQDARRAKLVSFSLGGAGAALALTGLVLIATRDTGAPEWADFEPSTTLSREEYAIAELEAEAAYDLAQEEHEIRKEDRTWIAGFCVAAGGVSLGAMPFAAQGSLARGDDPSLFWDAAAADALLLAHNNATRAKLGLPPLPDPNASAARPSLPEAEDDEEPGEPPPEPDEGAPAEPTPADEDGPAFLIQPLFGPVFAGVSVRF
ncbi:MAG: hypothetical protein ACOZNI_32100 [Myxococcota bacterium]